MCVRQEENLCGLNFQERQESSLPAATGRHQHGAIRGGMICSSRSSVTATRQNLPQRRSQKANESVFSTLHLYAGVFKKFCGVQLIANVVLVSGVQQSDSDYIYICIFFFRFFSIIGYYKMLGTVPWALQQVLVVYLFYIQTCVYFNPKLLLYPSPSICCF